MSTSTIAARYDLDRVRYVTAHFLEMQGLRLVPFGVWLLVLGAAAAGQLPFGRSGAVGVMGATLGLAWLAARSIGQSYDRRFGQVASTRRGLTRGEMVCGGLGAVTGVIHSTFDSTVSLPALLLSAVLLRAWYSGMRRQRVHYLALTLLFLTLGLSPLFSWGPAAGVSEPMLLVAFGWMLIVMGVGNHAVLVDTLRPLPSEDRDGAV